MMWHVAVVIGIIPLAQIDPLTYVSSLSEQLRSPARVAVAVDGKVLVTDTFHNHIARYNAGGTLLGTWSVPEGPIGVAVHPTNGNYYVSLRDEGKVGIYVYDDIADEFNRTGFLGDGEAMVTFVRPTDIDIAPATGRIFVVDPEGDRWYMFNAEGTFRAMGGVRGELNGQLKYPSAISVDEAHNRMMIADHDNFRVQIYTLTDDGEFTYATFERKFGYRLKYLLDGTLEGWMPRPLGLAVDSTGRVFVSDALMGTVRVFDSAGVDMGKVIDYGPAPGGLQTPVDLTFSPDGSQLYVVSTGSASVEVYGAPALGRASGGAISASRTSSVPQRGTNESQYDQVRRAEARSSPGERDARGRTAKPGLRGEAPQLQMDGVIATTGFGGPHMVEGRIICGRCHGIPDLPGGHLGIGAGQVNLCISCHNGAGQAMDLPLHGLDLADPYGTNPDALDGFGRSHAWGVSPVNASADSVGPVADGIMDHFIDGAIIKCATCHDQHSSDADSPYLRMVNDHDQMCKECHAARDEGLGELGTHPVGFDYPGGSGEFPVDGSVTPLEIKGGNVECQTCHATHHADSGGANDGEGDGMLLRDANDESLCLTCHTEHVGHTPGGPWQPTCGDCHVTHDPDNENLSLVGAQVNGTSMTFQDNDLGANGLHDFIHSNHDPVSYDGMCEVCHTDTTYHRNTADGNHTHFVDMLCTDCHPHGGGFMPAGGACDACHGQPPDGAEFPNTAGAHATHMTAANGPNIAECSACHAPLENGLHLNDLASFASGVDVNVNGNIDLDETDVCDSCHSPDGPFDGVAEARSNWAAGAAVSCEGCHDNGTSTIQGVSAPPVAGDNVTWGYFATGHGRGAMVPCAACHDAGAIHFDGLSRTYTAAADNYQEGFRLESVGGLPPLEVPRSGADLLNPYDDPPYWELCLSCHDRYGLLGGPTAPLGPYYGAEFGTNFRSDPSVIIPDGLGTDIAPYSMTGATNFNSHYRHLLAPPASSDTDHDGVVDSFGTCIDCHNVHGSTSPAMVRDGKLIGMEPALNFTYVRYDRHDPFAGGCEDPIIMTSAGGVTLAESHGGVMRSDSGPAANGICNFCHASGSTTDDPEYVINCYTPDAVDYYRNPLEISASCVTCHGVPPETGAHLTHFGGDPDLAAYGTADNLSTPSAYTFQCGSCHPLASTSHLNGTVDVELYNGAAPAGTLKNRNPSTASYTPGGTPYTDADGIPYTLGTCSNVYCHSETEWSSPDPISAPLLAPEGWPILDGNGNLTYDPYTVTETTAYASVNWGDSALDCNACHRNGPQTTYPDVQAAVGNSHGWLDDYGYEDLHAWSHGYDPLTCRVCHYGTVTAAMTWSRDAAGITSYDDVPIADKSYHVNGVKDVAFDTVNPVVFSSSFDLTGMTYDPVTKVCASTPCHLNQTDPEWGKPYRYYNSLECDQCHRYGGPWPPGERGGIGATADRVDHSAYVDQDCLDCHGDGPVNHERVERILRPEGLKAPKR